MRWLQEEFGLTDGFFANLLAVDERTFFEWKSGDRRLFKHRLDNIGELRITVMHILSSLDFNLELAHQVFEQETRKHPDPLYSPFVPPWNGTSMKAYLEANGRDGVTNMNRWWQHLRFGNSF
ncbi:MAG TPA: hypothetical protein VGB73_17180 [Pyrinomonadaceae bacterium]